MTFFRVKLIFKCEISWSFGPRRSLGRLDQSWTLGLLDFRTLGPLPSSTTSSYFLLTTHISLTTHICYSTQNSFMDGWRKQFYTWRNLLCYIAIIGASSKSKSLEFWDGVFWIWINVTKITEVNLVIANKVKQNQSIQLVMVIAIMNKNGVLWSQTCMRIEMRLRCFLVI